MLLLFYKKYVIIYKKDFYKSNRGSGKRDCIQFNIRWGSGPPHINKKYTPLNKKYIKYAHINKKYLYLNIFTPK